MKSFDEKYLMDDKKLTAYTGKYKDTNPISQFLVNNFYNSLNQIVMHMKLGEDARLLEVGCGAGISSLRIRNMLTGQHFEISDIEDNAMQLLSMVNFPIKFSKESVTQLERKDRDFTCIFMLEVLEHVPE
jgi:2-polyprenyl-3-methyl-5-hydroxy-6-metoxy-1,4-benzoquinol methylase